MKMLKSIIQNTIRCMASANNIIIIAINIIIIITGRSFSQLVFVQDVIFYSLRFKNLLITLLLYSS
jgi:hypothetical protein